MSITASDFVKLLTQSCRQTKEIVEDHLRDFDNEILVHLLIADIRRFCIERFEAQDTDVLERCLGAIGLGLTDGDEDLENAIAVSFVEDTGWWDPLMEPFIATWPLPLQAEAKRQKEWAPGNI